LPEALFVKLGQKAGALGAAPGRGII
jgi:hypothetical protein